MLKKVKQLDPEVAKQLAGIEESDSLINAGNVSTPAEQYEERLRVLQQKRSFESRFRSTLRAYGQDAEQESVLGGAVRPNKNLGHLFQDVIVPFSQPFDPADYAMSFERRPLEMAAREKPKIAFASGDTTLQTKGAQDPSSPVLDSPSLQAKLFGPLDGLFHRFIDWIAGLFGKNEKNDLDEPIIRDREAQRDSLKRLNGLLEKMRDLVQHDIPAGTSADAELTALFHRFKECFKEFDFYKKLHMALSTQSMTEAHEKLKLAHKKYFEALNKTLWISKFSKLLKIPSAVATAATATAFVVAGTIAVAGLLTGGVAGLLGVLATAVMWFGIIQGISFIAQGFSKGIGAVINYKVGQHKANMTKARQEIDLQTFEMQEDIKDILRIDEEASKGYEQLSHIQRGKVSTTSSFKN